MWYQKYIKKSFELGVVFSSFIGVFVSFLPFGDFWWVGLIIVLGVFVVVTVFTFLWFLFKKNYKIVSFANHTISAKYGNIFSIKAKEKPVVVIPVNTSFDYIVEEDLSIKDPIVSPKTLQGQFIKKMTNLEKDKVEELGKEIENAIITQGLVPRETVMKRGNQKFYELGSYIFLERENCTYMLFALTDFDEHNIVVSKPVSTFAELISKLISDINKCSGRPIYIPVMGVGLSGFGIDHKNSFILIKEALLAKKLTLRNDVTIVIYTGDREKVSIYD